jgi:FkbH-like protein
VLEWVRTVIDTVGGGFRGFGGLVVVQGIAAPQTPPHGRADARLPTGHHKMISELDAHLRALVADRPNMMFIDEERLAGNHGKAALLDDMFNVSAHHGASGPRMAQLLAREYLDAFVILSGLRRIKCIVTDLDNTLWSGVVGEGDGPSASAHPFPGIREALAMIGERGILLASCSKNNHDDVMQFWRGVDDLRPEDFVMHAINWDPKSQNLARIFDKVGLAPDAVLVIDDHPVERAEIAAAFPGIRVVGDDLATLRATLLTDPYLQPNVITTEARERTASTQALLSREAARERAPDREAFLRSLEIQLEVRRVMAHFDRLAELSQRTNQFNTTLVRYDARRLAALAADPDASVWSLAVRDRFAAYGIVGLCVIRGDEIENISISCRVLGLGVDQPFLASVLDRVLGLGVDQPFLASVLDTTRRMTGRIVIGERNQPSRRIFGDAGFREVTPNEFVRDATDRPPTFDASIYRVS